MPSPCSVQGCRSVGKKGCGVRFFRFPTPTRYEKEFRKWLESINRSDWTPCPDARVCSKHFVDGRPTIDNPYPTLQISPNPAGIACRLQTTLSATASAGVLSNGDQIAGHEYLRGIKIEPQESLKIEPRESLKIEPRESPDATPPDQPAATFSTISRGILILLDAQSPVFSATGGRVFYRGGGITCTANGRTPSPAPRYRDPTNPPTPPRYRPQYRDPTNPPSPDAERQKRLAQMEREATGNRRLQTLLSSVGALPQTQPPPSQPMISAPKTASAAQEKESAMDISDVTFTDSEDEYAEARATRLGSVQRPEKKKAGACYLSSLASLNDAQRTKVLVKYIKKYRRARALLLKVHASRKREEALREKAEKEKHFGWHRFVRDDGEGDDAATLLWTGLPSYKVLERLFNDYLKEEAEKLALTTARPACRIRKRKLELRDEFLFTMVRLRTKLSGCQLAFIFGVKHNYGCRILRTWVPFLAAKRPIFAQWTPAHELQNFITNLENF